MRPMASREHKRVPTSPKSDLCQTPPHALTPLYPYLPKHWTIWEPACGEGHLVRGLESSGYQVIASDIIGGLDFFRYTPFIPFDAIVTNPPFSCKVEFLARCYELGRPFALLLPVEILGVHSAQKLFERFGIEVILLSQRVGFKTVNTTFAKSSAWFPTAWYTWGLSIGAQLTFAKITKRPNEQMVLI
jgi:hypothetical protein